MVARARAAAAAAAAAAAVAVSWRAFVFTTSGCIAIFACPQCLIRSPVCFLAPFVLAVGQRGHRASAPASVQVQIRPSSKVIIKFLEVMQKHGEMVCRVLCACARACLLVASSVKCECV